MSELIDATIVICTRDRVNSLRDTLESLKVIQLDGLALKLVVVDNGSQDNTAKVVRETIRELPFLGELITEPARGKSRAYNRAFADMKSDVIVSTDDDVRFSPLWLSRLIGPIRSGKFDAVGGWVEMPQHLRRPWMTPELFNFFACSHSNQSPAFPGLVGANMAFSRRALEVVGQFDERLGPGTPIGLGEETLFQRQIERSGMRVGYVRDAVVEHHFDPDRLRLASILRGAECYGRATGYIGYHWDGNVAVFPRFRTTLKRLRLRLQQSKRLRQGFRPDDFDPVQFRLARGVGRLSQFAAERHVSRRYASARWKFC